MGRGKIEIKKIENHTNRQVTFSKRRGGLLKKAKELAVLCDVQLGVIIFSSSGKMFEYSSPSLSIPHIIERYQRYQRHTNTRIEAINNQQQIYCEITRMRNENEKLQLSMRQYTGEDLNALNMNDLDQLEAQLEMSVGKVRARKHQVLRQQVENLRRKEHILEAENSYLTRAIEDHQTAMEHHQAMAAAAMEQQTAEHKVVDIAMFDHYTHYYQEDQSRNLLALHPFRLQPTQPNLQETCLLGHNLQL